MSVTRFGKVAVLMGGWSSERAVSLNSGSAVLQALLRRGVDAHGIDVGPGVARQLSEGDYQRAFVMLHGRGGEDGVIQGVLESLGIPYTGSGVLGSALSMDKVKSKQIWQAAGLPALPFELLLEESNPASVVERLGLPLAVKPAREGSSIGISKVTQPAQLLPAWREAARYDTQVLVEPWLDGGEYTAAILGDEELPLIRIEAAGEFYDYHAKYQAQDTCYYCPSGLPVERERELRQIALRAFRAVGAAGWGRVDFLLDEQGKAWLVENNTLPGMTDHSLVPMAAQAAGIGFDDLVVRILAESLEYRSREEMHVVQAR